MKVTKHINPSENERKPVFEQIVGLRQKGRKHLPLGYLLLLSEDREDNFRNVREGFKEETMTCLRVSLVGR